MFKFENLINLEEVNKISSLESMLTLLDLSIWQMSGNALSNKSVNSAPKCDSVSKYSKVNVI